MNSWLREGKRCGTYDVIELDAVLKAELIK